MSNLSDKDIDRLSQEAAEFYEPDDSMLSWNKLERQLVKPIPERPPDIRSSFRMRPLIWGPSVLLLAAISYYIIKNTAYRKDSTLKTQTENITAKSPGNTPLSGTERPLPASGVPDVNPEPGEAVNANARASGVGSGSNNSPDKILSDAGGNGLADKAGKKPFAENRDYGNTGSGILIPGKNAAPSHSYGDNNKKTKPGGSQNLSGEEMAAGSSSITENDLTNTGNSAFATTAKQTQHQLHNGVVHLPPAAVFISSPVVRGNDSSLNRFALNRKPGNKIPARSLQTNRSLVIGLVMGPDYTDVGSMPNNQLGNNTGISLGYYLTSRLSVNTGFSYSAKYYWSTGEPFQPRTQPLNPAISSYAPFPHIESVNGRCSMFEIPLTLRYDVYQHEKIKLFVNAGLSSYLVRKQNYTYFFHNAGRAYEWQNENKDRLSYWFAIGNLSAGIEQDLGKGFTFQAEPFVRLPFSGIGVGNLKMNSYGLLFSIRYSPVLGRVRK
jgi:hypothetical protein